MKYKVVRARSMDSLQDDVNQLLSEGYVLTQSSLAVVQIYNGNAKVYYREMVKFRGESDVTAND